MNPLQLIYRARQTIHH